MKHKITVIIPTYNRWNSLKNTIKALLPQDCKIIVVNDGCKENKEVVDKLNTNKKILYLKQVVFYIF